MAAKESCQCHQPSTYRSISLHSLHGVFRTWGNIAAGRWQHRGNGPFISSQHLKRDALGKSAHGAISAFRIPALGFLFSRVVGKLPFNDYESLASFVQQRTKLNVRNNFLRIDHDVSIRSRPRPREPHRLAQASLDPIALNGSSERASHRKADPKPTPLVAFRLQPRQVKNGERCREMSPPLLVYTLKVGMP